jgi:acyl-CoA synthetase (AMP-forming)/AMP-acid ligase II
MTRAANLLRNPEQVPGTVFESIEAHAYRNKKRTAVLMAGSPVSYGRMCHDVMTFACALHEQGVRPGTRLAVNALDSYVHWTLLLAAETLGAITVSLHPTEKSETLKSIIPFVELWVGEEPTVAVSDRAKLIVTNSPWTSAAFQAPVDHALFDRIFHPIALDEGQRMRRSSGTTGGMKLMLSTRCVEESRMRAYSEFMGITADSRYLVSKSFIVSSAYLTANLCLRIGATVAFDDGSDQMVQIRDNGITHLRLFQDQLLNLLDAIEADHSPKPNGVTLILGAAPVSQQLWDAALEKIASQIVYTYNANECGSICFMGPEGRGVIRPGVVLQVIDENDQPLPIGQAGRIRVRTPSQISGYLDNPEMTQQNFRDGWFYTGDMGIVHSEREIELVGRADDVLNIAGYKHSAPQLEKFAYQVPGVKEVCATSGRSEFGVDFLALVVVLEKGAKQALVGSAILSCFPKSMLDTTRVFFTQKLLRTESGKLRRKAIGDMLKSD